MSVSKDEIFTLSLARRFIIPGLLCVFFITAPGLSPACHRGEPHGKDTGCVTPPPPEGESSLDITYEFGELSGGACVTPDCVATTLTASGYIECTNNYCLFRSNSVVDDFHLPAGLRDLLFATEWRGTPLDPDQCFGSSPANPASGTALIDDTQLELRRYGDDDTPWFAQVSALALDTEGLEVRNYTFNFEGCGETSCGVFAPASMAGVYVGGKLIRIDGKGPDKKFQSVPCRCTISNTPDCPAEVPVPSVPLRISVSESP